MLPVLFGRTMFHSKIFLPAERNKALLVFKVVNSFLSSESSRSVRQILVEVRLNPVSLVVSTGRCNTI